MRAFRSRKAVLKFRLRSLHAANSAHSDGIGRAGLTGICGIIRTHRTRRDPTASNCPDSPRNESLAQQVYSFRKRSVLDTIDACCFRCCRALIRSVDLYLERVCLYACATGTRLIWKGH